MKHFWKGFQSTKSAAPVRFKKHVIILYWDPKDPLSTTYRNGIRSQAIRHPSVSIKVVELGKDPTKASKHNILSTPTVVLLKDGREVDRISGADGTALLSMLFRKAQT